MLFLEVLKIVEILKILIKMKYFQTFCKPQTALYPKEIIQASNHHHHHHDQIKASHVSGKNFFRKDIYRNIQTFALQVLREYSSWVSRHGTVQVFFLIPTRITFLDVLQEYISIMLSDLRFIKWAGFFDWNFIAKR